MFRKVVVAAAGVFQPRRLPIWNKIASRTVSTSFYTVNSMILRSLKDHYLDVSKMTPPLKISPPSPYTVVKGALDSGGPILRSTFKNEEITISAMRLVDIIPEGSGLGNDEGDFNQLFVHVDISKEGMENSLHFLCGLYPDALGIHSVSLRKKSESAGFIDAPKDYSGPVFEEIDEKVRDALHSFIEERGINESLFPFLQAWLYVKDHRNLMRWFKTLGTFVKESDEAASQL
ncbi:hypothetical protein M569_04309 [Genlisea aurea]|uniref:Mitochondrial glycoprotein family protein n=1 Tax=Genlisea aurea TaxID=192259 RepID=S8CZE1_9LAMI|nr:hypothetical protein M569_04309 [Genlisea aurea]